MQMAHVRLSGALSRRAHVSSHLENVAMHVSLPELRHLLYSPRNANTILYGSEYTLRGAASTRIELALT